MVRDTHTLRRSVLEVLTQQDTVAIPDMAVFLSVEEAEVRSAVNFLKMAKMVEVADDLVAKTDGDRQTHLAQIYNQLKVGRTYDRKQLANFCRPLPITPNNAVTQLIKHGALERKSGNSFLAKALPPLLGVSYSNETFDGEVNDGQMNEVDVVSATRRLVWEVLTDNPMTRDEMYDLLLSKYDISKTSIGQNITLLGKNGCLTRDPRTKVITQLPYIPFDIDLFYHAIKDRDVITHKQAMDVCKEKGINSRSNNLVNSLIHFGALSYTDTKAVFKVNPLPQIEEAKEVEVVEVEPVVVETAPVPPVVDITPETHPRSVESMVHDTRLAKQAYDEIIKGNELKIREIDEITDRITRLQEAKVKMEREVTQATIGAKEKYEKAKVALNKALSQQGLID